MNCLAPMLGTQPKVLDTGNAWPLRDETREKL